MSDERYRQRGASRERHLRGRDGDGSRIDAIFSVEFKAKLLSLVSDGATGVVLDVADVEFIDSRGLEAIIAVLKQLGPSGETALCGTQEPVKHMLRLTRMDRVFHLCDAPEEAFDLISG